MMSTSAHEQRGSSGDGGGLSPYARFAGMIATSTIVMFVLTYTNVFDVAHIHFSQERLYMAILMGSAMTIIMLGWMWKMHPDRRVNVGISAGALVVGAAAFHFSQTQAVVYDANYMRGMIPHHSIAILTSERAGIQDVRVRKLADGIIAAQKREIAEMEWLLQDIEENGVAANLAEGDARPVPSFEAAP